MGFLENLKRSIARIGVHGLRGRALICASAAAAIPIVALFSLSAGSGARAEVFAVCALVASSLFLVLLSRSLRPVGRLARWLDEQGGVDRAAAPVDDAERLLANMRAIGARLTTAETSGLTHPVTLLPMREQLLAAISDDLKARPGHPAQLGLIRFANYDQLEAFDPEAAARILRIAAQRLSGAVKPGRPTAQVDRDCFGIWFGDGGADAAAELEALAYVLMQEIPLDAFAVTPDIQLGSAHYPLDADEPGNLLNRAFVSLARPQRSSDGRIAFFARPSQQEARRRFLLEQDLRQAIRRSELALHYQPIVDVAAGAVVGAEALLRWRCDRGEQGTPGQIVKVLEEIGLVHEIGLWTLNTACRQLRAWRELGLPDLKIAVNLSAQQLRDRALPTALIRTLEAHALTPAQIELELTETAAMEDASRTLLLFEELREAGFSLAIDDFGSGYSSLAYLRRLPFQKLKIDREFVAHVDERSDSRTICKALIELTTGLELAVLAEGVERYEEVETLRALGCSTFQGYYFSRPLPAEDFIATVTDADWLARAGSRVHRDREELRRRLV